MQNVQSNIDQSNERYQRIMFRMSIIWIAISFISILFASIGAFTNHPDYLHDWHGIAILLLAIIVLGMYTASFLSRRVFRNLSEWPPPFSIALIHWLSIYICIGLLWLLDAQFSWCFFIVFGLSFAFFRSGRLLLMVSIVYATICITQGYLTWPLAGSNIGALIGFGISFLAMAAVSILIQHLITEQHERSRLLQQLSHAHTELEDAHHKLAESAAQEQELAVLRERTRLAREMHDTLGHALVLVSIKLEAAQRLRERDPERCDRELESTKEIVRTSMNELRASIANLRSPALEQEPACRAISRYAQEMARRAGLHFFYDLHPGIEGLPEQIEETLWKVGQEALTNVEKHARAQSVTLHISRQNGYITMRIQDDGVGLPQELCQIHANGEVTCTSPRGHYGLSGMFERVESAGGRIYLRPGQAQGTTIEVELPLVEAPLPGL